MKKLLFISLASIFCFFSCGSDDSDEESTTVDSEIVGKWRLLSETDEDGDLVVVEECEKETIREFTSNNNFRQEFVASSSTTEQICTLDIVTELTYNVDGDQVTFITDEGNFTTTFVLDGDFLTFLDADNNGDRATQTYIRTTDPFFSEINGDLITNEENSLIGNWKYTSGTLDGADIPLTPCGDSEIVHFSENNEYITEDLIEQNGECVLGQLITADYEVSGNQITFINASSAIFENFIFEFNIEGEILSLTSMVSGFEVVSFYSKTNDSLVSEL